MKSDLAFGLIENEFNPVMLFGQSGEVRFLNRSAELLASFVNIKLFYDLAVAHAPKSFGFKTTMQMLNYDKFNFFALTVGYVNEEEIAIILYQQPVVSNQPKLSSSNLTNSNIYMLIDLALSSAGESRCKKYFDVDIPEFKLHQAEFLKLLRHTLETMETDFTISLRLKAGEFKRTEGSKHRLIELKMEGHRNTSRDNALKNMGETCHIGLFLDSKHATFDVPMIID